MTVFQTGSMQRSSNEFRKAWRAGAQWAHRQSQTGHRRCGPAFSAVRPGGRDDGTGPELGSVAGPAPSRPYNSVLSPRGCPSHFPNCGTNREYSGGMMTDWARTISTSRSGGWAWTRAGRWRSSRRKTPRPRAACATFNANGVEMIHGDSAHSVYRHRRQDPGQPGQVLRPRPPHRRGTARDKRDSPLQELQPKPKTSWIVCAAARSPSATWRSAAAP